MNIIYFILITSTISIYSIKANCGCLKCCKDMHIASPPNAPCKIIYRGTPSKCQAPLPYSVQVPIIPPPIPHIPRSFDYKIETFPIRRHIEQPCEYSYSVQAPIVISSIPAPPLTGLLAITDRIVLPTPNSFCPPLDKCYGNTVTKNPNCRAIWDSPIDQTEEEIVEDRVATGPIIERLSNNIFRHNAPCDCNLRYASRHKRDLPILHDSFKFLLALVPHFIKFPFVQTLKALNYHAIPRTRRYQKSNLLRKLQRINHPSRYRRSTDFGESSLETLLPFLKVIDITDHDSSRSIEDASSSSEEEDNFVGGSLAPPKTFWYLIKAPMRFLIHFRNFGKEFKSNILNIFSHLIGDFERHPQTDWINKPKYRRYRREAATNHPRSKRYILKVVDEDEVQQFLREKLGGSVSTTNTETNSKNKNKERKLTKKRKLVVEKLSPKIIFDNNGRTFVEINGNRRPIILNRPSIPKIDNTPESQESSSISQEDVKEKIDNLINKAKRQHCLLNHNRKEDPAKSNQILKEKLSEILGEAQNLIDMNLSEYTTLHDDLSRIQLFKQKIINEWKQLLMKDQSDDPRILNHFGDLQEMKNSILKRIAGVLTERPANFLVKKLIKMLVRLQKLQCVINRVVEDFDAKIKSGSKFNIDKQMKYIEILENLNFATISNKENLEEDLKKERDDTLKNEMKLLDFLRNLDGNSEKSNQQAELLWELRNIDKLEKDSIREMNEKIKRGQKIRKELRILFDLLKQWENCETKQKRLLAGEELREDKTKYKPFRQIQFEPRLSSHQIITEDKKPVTIFSNGYALRGYKITDNINN